MIGKKFNETGQVIVVLLLTMLGALVIGLTITQRSLNDVSTSTQTEQSTRAFSAAEAGLEKIFAPTTDTYNSEGVPISEAELGNNSSAVAYKINQLPRNCQALEYPPIGKETVAQFWLVDPMLVADVSNHNLASLSLTEYNESLYNKPCNDASSYAYKSYAGNTVDVYWGNSDLSNNLIDPDTPALEVNLITKDFSSNAFKSYRFFYDPLPSTQRANGFQRPDPSCGAPPYKINTTNSKTDQPTDADRDFRCKVSIPPSGVIGSNEKMFIVRVRVLYSNANQAVALKPQSGFSLPSQAIIYSSTGTSGLSRKTIQVFQLQDVASPLFDFALFSAGSVTKNR
jgi:hypothetical protein